MVLLKKIDIYGIIKLYKYLIRGVKMKRPVTIGVVHTHTHTGYNLVNILRDIVSISLLVVEEDK